MWTSLRELNLLTIILRILLAVIIGGIIGWERERQNQPAGFRTHMLVCLGASLVMITNQYIIMHFAHADPARLGAQVISGIGFLGAGTIIVTRKNQVRGLTTAAGLWVAACVGLAIGIGFYEGAIAVGIIILCIMTIFHKVDMILLSNSNNIRLYLIFADPSSVTNFINYCKEKEYKLIDIQLSKDNGFEKGNIVVMTRLKLKKKKIHIDIIEDISKIQGLNYIEEI